jgi:hypothetical protein
MTKNNKKCTTEKIVFLEKNSNLLIPRPPLRTPKPQDKSSALKREHQAIQKVFEVIDGLFKKSYRKFMVP